MGFWCRGREVIPDQLSFECHILWLHACKLYLWDHKCLEWHFFPVIYGLQASFPTTAIICETLQVHRCPFCLSLFFLVQICVLSSNHIIISLVPKGHNRMITSHLPNAPNNEWLDILNFSIYICTYFAFHCCLWLNFWCSNLRNVVMWELTCDHFIHLTFRC